MIGRLGRYLNNATQKPDGLPYAAAAGRVVSELRAAVVGFEQLLGQLARFLEREAEHNPPSLYDDRRDPAGAVTARETAAALVEAVDAVHQLDAALAEPARLAYHLGSD